MREIKFRGMTIRGDWVYGFVSRLKEKRNGVDAGWYISNSCGSPFAFDVRPETVGQFSNFNDMHGEKIYEGDIIEWAFAPGMEEGFGAVIYNTTSGAWYVENDDLDIYTELYNVFDYSQVIGNIHTSKTFS